MIRRIAVAILGVGLVGLAGFLLLSRRPVIAAIERPAPESFAAESVAHGEALAAAGHCASCHTSAGRQAFAGGYGVNTPFGIIYGTNITPDPKTGIGTWSLEAFRRAMREGVARDGSHLFPAFPYNAYTKLTDDDLNALYAYLMTRPPASATVPSNTVPFPLSVRAFQEGWKILFSEADATGVIRRRAMNGIAELIWLRALAIVVAAILRETRSAAKGLGVLMTARWSTAG